VAASSPTAKSFVVHIDPELLALGREIRRRRLAAGLSQEDLAAASGLHVNYVGGVERGERNCGVKTFLRIAQGLNINPAELFTGFAPRSVKAHTLSGLSQNEN
jgi:transcriptional regulator with XRE-family HTH domain